MKLDDLDVHADVTLAEMPPGEFYRDQQLYDQVVNLVFRRSWQLDPSGETLTNAEHVRPFTLLDGSLNEPMLFTRDEAGVLRCISNVCTHRAALLVDAPCRTKAIRCTYHGRRFSLDGRFRFAPEFEDAQAFPRPEDDLARIDCAEWGPLRFASLNPTAEFEDFVREPQQRLSFLDLEQFTYEPSGARSYTVDGNWALYLENYLEGMHIPFLHPGLAKTLDVRSYGYELFPGGVLQLGLASKNEDVVFEHPKGHADHGKRVAAYYYHLFPNTLLNFYPWGLSVNVVLPQGPEQMRVQYQSYVSRPELRLRGAGGDLEQVEQEDQSAVSSVARGLRSALYRRGRYAPSHELGVHHFHRWLVGHSSTHRLRNI